MQDDIVTRLEILASNYKTAEFEFVYADHETVCEASAEIERLREQIKALVYEWELSERGVHCEHREVHDEI
jgi:hypothetical protein